MCVVPSMPLIYVSPEDELQNVELAESERDKKNQELKIKRKDYTGYDDDEFAPGNEGMKRSLLAKYDEFLEGPKEQVSAEYLSLTLLDTHLVFRGFALEAVLPQRSRRQQKTSKEKVLPQSTSLCCRLIIAVRLPFHISGSFTHAHRREYRDFRLSARG